MVKRRRGWSAGPTQSNAGPKVVPVAASQVVSSEVVPSQVVPSEAVPSDPVEPRVVAPPETPAPEELPAESHPVSALDALLETVSPEALRMHPSTEHPEASAAPVEVENQSEPAPAEPEVSAAAESIVSRDDAPPEPAEPAEPAPPAPAPAEPLPVAAQSLPDPIIPPTKAPQAALSAVTELTEVNAALIAFVQSESTAAMSHWRALAAAKSPADAMRLQVDEMQRAADASLTCFSALANRAGRLVEAIRRP